MQIKRDFFERDPQDCAVDLIGCIFQWDGCAGRIVETEAYAEHGDEACHTFFRPSAREFVARQSAGSAYVYLNYGMYWLTNILCKNPVNGNNGFVLLRALEPISGIEKMKKRRKMEVLTQLCSGPGKLSMALSIGREDHGKSLVKSKARGFLDRDPERRITVLADRRIGISKAKELEWRFLEEGSQHLSIGFGKAK